MDSVKHRIQLLMPDGKDYDLWVDTNAEMAMALAQKHEPKTSLELCVLINNELKREAAKPFE